MVHKGRERVGDGDFLSAALGTRGDKDTAHLAGERGLAPEWPRGVPERLTDRMSTRHGALVRGRRRTFHCTGKLP